MEELKEYLEEAYGVTLNEENEDEYDILLHNLILKYGQEQRKEGYIKGFEDGENADG